ncbi:hypothetical protein DL98DRAFT_537691 [Cadophora sp. DSE1049]|nr:hypothetical protein DL98DRAFT_537691 [Cadophora sp. DSE1049]
MAEEQFDRSFFDKCPNLTDPGTDPKLHDLTFSTISTATEIIDRRREQNRISQRTFKEKRAQQVADLEESYNELLRSNEALQLEVNAAIKLLAGGGEGKLREMNIGMGHEMSSNIV